MLLVAGCDLTTVGNKAKPDKSLIMDSCGKRQIAKRFHSHISHGVLGWLILPVFPTPAPRYHHVIYKIIIFILIFKIVCTIGWDPST
jgi:hypothetical protein